MQINYFQGLSFFWAFLAVGSRIAMGVMGTAWKTWETEGFYKAEKPWYINGIGVLGLALVVITWIMTATAGISYSWILALLVTLTAVKVSFLLFNYRAFRELAVLMLEDSSKMRLLNISVLTMASVLVLMGIFLY